MRSRKSHLHAEVLRSAALLFGCLALLLVAAPSFAAPNCDADGDGFLKDNRKCGGSDCNDDDPTVNPAAAEVCGDAVDNDCNGFADEGCSGGSFVCESGPDAGLSCLTDFDCGVCISGTDIGASCADDSDCLPNTGPGNQRGRCEVHLCIEETGGPTCTDADGDGYATEGGTCGAVDCDDSDFDVNPGAAELCDGFDNDCDGTIDEGCSASLPTDIAAAGDSITQAFAASCSCNTDFFCLLCLLGGDQPENSWFDGSSSSVYSVHDRYLESDGGIGANKSASADGSEMRGGSNNFSSQADQILAQTPLPDHVEVELGGNDLCSRDCIDPANCGDPVYTDAEWTQAVQAGLDKLVAGLPDGSTVYLMGVPRVQDLRGAGLTKQSQASNVDCEGVWSDYGICTIGTQGTTLNGESIQTRLAGLAERQQRYNEILRDEAAAYDTNANGLNPRGIEVVADYVDEATPSIGTFSFGADDIDGGDCFHPSIAGQNMAADLSWQGNPDR
jgi:lysophospholipase L1-like esterase